ncbi:MAG: hypothetical protein WB392_00980 [Methanotrichaceae archaeon]
MPTKIDELLKSKLQERLAIAARHGACNVRVFGQWLEEKLGLRATLDILVEMEPWTSLMDHVALMQDLGDLLDE